MKYFVYQFHVINFCRGQGNIYTSSAIKKYINKFGVRCIAIISICTDNEFNKVRYIIRPIKLEISTRDKHVGDIERELRKLKEKCRCKKVFVPYKRMPSMVIKENLKDNVHWHNIFTPKDYILQAIAPEVIILGQDKPDYPNLKLDVVQYCQEYERTRNNMTPRSVGGISLIPKNDRVS